MLALANCVAVTRVFAARDACLAILLALHELVVTRCGRFCGIHVPLTHVTHVRLVC